MLVSVLIDATYSSPPTLPPNPLHLEPMKPNVLLVVLGGVIVPLVAAPTC